MDKHGFGLISGGLVEVVEFGNPSKPLLQFMHQTVKDFVMSPFFKVDTLGAKMGRFVKENGHSFIAKHSFVSCSDLWKLRQLGQDPCPLPIRSVPLPLPVPESLLYHARESETTTGSIQFDFFKRENKNGNLLVLFAVQLGLLLCIDDLYKADSDCIRCCSADLVGVLCRQLDLPQRDLKRHDGIEQYLTSEEVESTTRMAESLVAKG